MDTAWSETSDSWDCKKYEDAQATMDQIAEDYQDKHPKLAELISEHAWETLGVYHAAPAEHHKRLRTTNMIERVNQELKRRSKVVRIFPNPKSCLRLFTALLKEWHEDWAYGKIYLDMEHLEEFEEMKRVQHQERAPDVESNSIKKKKMTVA